MKKRIRDEYFESKLYQRENWNVKQKLTQNGLVSVYYINDTMHV